MLLREAAELRRQAEKEGGQAYHRKPSVRGHPNSRFLPATVLGVQQANKTVEVNEMWQARQKELPMDGRLKSHSICQEDSNRSPQSSSKNAVQMIPVPVLHTHQVKQSLAAYIVRVMKVY